MNMNEKVIHKQTKRVLKIVGLTDNTVTIHDNKTKVQSMIRRSEFHKQYSTIDSLVL